MISSQWLTVCKRSDLIDNSGIAVLSQHQQIAVFYLPNQDQKVYALSNFDPDSGANVIARGIIGDIKGELMVASPLYKQHFSLVDGRCLNHSKRSIPSYTARIKGNDVQILFSA